MKKLFLLAATILVIIAGACRTTKPEATQIKRGEPFSPASIEKPAPPMAIYLTNPEYKYLVPVGLTDDRSTIASYPAPASLKRGGLFVTPVELANGFFLDQIGIGPNVAFLKFTYEEFYNLEQTLTIEEMMNAIVDSDPIKAMYRCRVPRDVADRVSYLNDIIMNNRFEQCEKLK